LSFLAAASSAPPGGLTLTGQLHPPVRPTHDLTSNDPHRMPAREATRPARLGNRYAHRSSDSETVRSRWRDRPARRRGRARVVFDCFTSPDQGCHERVRLVPPTTSPHGSTPCELVMSPMWAGPGRMSTMRARTRQASRECQRRVDQGFRQHPFHDGTERYPRDDGAVCRRLPSFVALGSQCRMFSNRASGWSMPSEVPPAVEAPRS
jgi:hypothetical protein